MPIGYYRLKGPKIYDQRVPSYDLPVIPGGNIDPGTVGTDAIADGAVTRDKLEASLLQGFHVEVGLDDKKPPSTDLHFATVTFGAEQWSDDHTLSLTQGGAMRIHVRLQLRGDSTDVVPGARAMALLVDHSGTAVAAGRWCDAVMTSDGVPEIVAEFDEEVVLLAGTVQGYRVRYLGQAADGGAVATWTVMKKDLAASPPLGGSFVEGMVVPRPSTG